ncbi:hypothetical protein B0H10DRAFT_1960977 [Mycena sp. CBHHK59/15]|nr:hypothetical protein B0H10DRAFT_1960977 [Mycena sp. CBHHK59/15]
MESVSTQELFRYLNPDVELPPTPDERLAEEGKDIARYRQNSGKTGELPPLAPTTPPNPNASLPGEAQPETPETEQHYVNREDEMDQRIADRRTQAGELYEKLELPFRHVLATLREAKRERFILPYSRDHVDECLHVVRDILRGIEELVEQNLEADMDPKDDIW